MKKTKILSYFIIMVLLVTTSSCGYSPSRALPFQGKPVIGIAWREDTDSEFFTNVCRAVEEAGGSWVMLDQVRSADLAYDEKGHLTEGVSQVGFLDESAVGVLCSDGWKNSNAREALKNISFVLFTGGEDVSPTLYQSPKPWHGIQEEADYNAERDVSDYLTMSYCLDHDIPLMGICRGMQMLSVISGAEIIQDIPTYFADRSLDYQFTHRNEKASPDAYRDYAPHDVQVVKGTLLEQMVGKEPLTGCPSWHHQAVEGVDERKMIISGYTETNGIKMIEAVERKDKTFALGLQFHPEAALVKNMDHAGNKNDFMNYETALSIFRWIVNEDYLSEEKAA